MHGFSFLPPVPKAELAALISQHAQDDAALLEGIAVLAESHGAAVYQEALHRLCGMSFDATLAERHWRRALAHRRRLLRPERLRSGLRAALLDYLHREADELADPRILEGSYLENITRSSLCDGLTGLYHQTYFKELLAKAVSQRRRDAEKGFALVLFDLDHFKQYNDRCGHLRGDDALRRTAQILQETLREGDVAARYGGEEFALLLPQADRGGAQIVAERIRRAIEDEPYPGQIRLDRRNLTVSGGVAVFPEDGTSADMLIEAADRRLYQAKVCRNAIYPLRHDRRRSTRFGVRSLVEYARVDGGVFRPALSRDISPYGISLGCEAPLETGTRLSLRLARPFWGDSQQLRATVRGARQQGGLTWLGLEFDRFVPRLEQLIPTGPPVPRSA